MEHGVDVAGDVAAEVRVAHIAGHYLQAVVGRNVFEPSPVVERVILSQGAHMATLGQETFHEV